MNLFKCKLCGEIFNNLDDVEYHIDTEHEEELEDLGLSVAECYEIVDYGELQRQIQTLKRIENRIVNLNQDSYPQYYKYPYPKKKGYQYYPYWKYIYYYYPKGKREKVFICTVHNFETNDPREMLKHILKYHREDAEEYMEHRASEIVLNRIRKKFGSTEHLTPEQLRRLARKELEEVFIKEELKSPQVSTAFFGWVEDRYERLSQFLTGKSDLCPLCNHEMEHLSMEEQEKYIANQVIKRLKKGMKLSKGDEKSFNKLVNRTYKGKWLDKEVSLSLRNVLHLYTRHRPHFETLFSKNILGGDLVKFLALEKWKDKSKTKMTLSDILEVKSPEDRMTTKERAYLEWLERGN